MQIKLRYLLVFILPALILYSMFIIYPLIDSLILSFFSWSGVGPRTFVGLKNFRTLFTGSFSKELFNAFSHNVYFFIMLVILSWDSDSLLHLCWQAR